MGNVIEIVTMINIIKSKYIIIMMGALFISLSSIRECYAIDCPAMIPVAVPASVDINPTLAVGTVLYTTSLSWGLTPIGCMYTPNNSAVYKFDGVGVPNGNIYPTGIPGLGYRGRINGWPAGFEQYWPLSKIWPIYLSQSSMSPGSLTFELIKTGPILPGNFPAQTIMTSSIDSVPFVNIMTASSIIVKPITPACTITQSAITVNLDDTYTSQLTTMGNTSKDKLFNIPLNCTSRTNISLAFSGNVADSTNAVFSNLSGGPNTTSVGVQILQGNMPVPTRVGSYLNLGLIDGSISVPFTARYYALTNNVGIGTVSSIAYASIIYN